MTQTAIKVEFSKLVKCHPVIEAQAAADEVISLYLIARASASSSPDTSKVSSPSSLLIFHSFGSPLRAHHIPARDPTETTVSQPVLVWWADGGDAVSRSLAAQGQHFGRHLTGGQAGERLLW